MSCVDHVVKLCYSCCLLSQHIDVVAEYKKKLENDRPILNLVIIGEQLLYSK